MSPRNSGGNYTLPAGQPVVSGTTITASTFNTLTADIATEVTDSLDRSGKGGMLAVLALQDGTVASPGVQFVGEPSSGLYRIGAGDIALAILGAKIAELTATVMTLSAKLTVTGAVTVTGDSSASAVVATGASGHSGGTFTGAGGAPGVIANGQGNQGPGIAGTGGNGQGSPGGQFAPGSISSPVDGAILLTPLTATPSLPSNGVIWVENISGVWNVKVRLSGQTKTFTVT